MVHDVLRETKDKGISPEQSWMDDLETSDYANGESRIQTCEPPGFQLGDLVEANSCFLIVSYNIGRHPPRAETDTIDRSDQ